MPKVYSETQVGEVVPRAAPILPLTAEAQLRVALWRRAAARRLRQPVRKPAGSGASK